MPLTTLHAGQPLGAPMPTVTVNLAAHDPFPPPGNIADEAATHAQRPLSDENVETLRSFDHLRKAMEGDDTSLFEQLQAALTDLVKVARSLEVATRCVMFYISRPNQLA